MIRRHSHFLDALFARIEPYVAGNPLGRAMRRRLHGQREVTRPRFELERGGVELDGLRIAFLSDVHAGHFMSEAELTVICEEVGTLGPDLVALGGDLINLYPHEAMLWAKGLAALAPPLGIWAVPGNHEYYAEPELDVWREVLENAGARVLLNRGERIEHGGATFWLAGIDDAVRGRPDLGVALHGARADEPIVLLSHNPDVFHEASERGVDLQISGHTHGGQILLFGRTPLRQTRHGFWSGHFAHGRSQLYVGRGVGVSVLPLRISAPGEITMVELVVRTSRDSTV